MLIIAFAMLVGLFVCGCAGTPRAVLRDAPPLDLPGVTVPEMNMGDGFDCNVPVNRDGQTMYLFCSAGHPPTGRVRRQDAVCRSRRPSRQGL